MPFIGCTVCLIYFSLSGGWTSRISTILHLVLHLQILSYLIVSFLRVRTCRTRLRQFYSSENSTNLSWLRIIYLCFALMWCLDFVNWTLHLIHRLHSQ